MTLFSSSIVCISFLWEDLISRSICYLHSSAIIEITFFYSTATLSGYILVLVAIDRFISISCPNIYLFRNNRAFQTALILFYVSFNFVAYIPVASGHLSSKNTTHNWTNVSSMTCESSTQTVVIFDMVILALVPFALVTVFTLLTISNIFRSRLKTKSNDRISNI